MGFTENIKLEVKKVAAFRCCRCQNIGVEIHHIIPQADGGPDTIENAAPLCAKCHADFGDNPIKRKEITQMRDWWYETVEKMYSPVSIEMSELVGRINSLVLSAQENSGKIEDLKSALRVYVENIIDKVTPESLQATATGVVDIIPLDTGFAIHPDEVAAEGYCACERSKCVESSKKMYCYWPKSLPEWVIRKRLYWKCYDELISCTRCGETHKRGHIGRLDVCRVPYKDQVRQVG